MEGDWARGDGDALRGETSAVAGGVALGGENGALVGGGALGELASAVI